VLVVPYGPGKDVPAPAPEESRHALPPALAAAFDSAGRSAGASPRMVSPSPPESAADPDPAPPAHAPAARDAHAPGRIESSVLGALPRVARTPLAAAPTGGLQWPLRGVLYARFGRKGKSPHDGIDLAAPVGTPVRTAAEGSVLFAGPQQGYGLLVIIEHPHGLVTVYAHNRDLRVRTGQQVREGQVIATVGESGKTRGPHLHFEVRQDGAPVDPLELLGPPPRS